MRFHVIGLPHTRVTKEFSSCAFTQKVLKFANMMSRRGHHVTLYGAGDHTEAFCTEFVSVLSEDERYAVEVTKPHYTMVPFDFQLPHWWTFNNNVIKELKDRIQPQDFICVIGGTAHQPIAMAFPKHMTVEFGIGYHGTFAPYRVFESYAHMHSVYAAQAGSSDIDGKWFDAVIPNYYEPEDFPFSEEKDEFFLFMGRMIDRKGIDIAQAACSALSARLIVIGPGLPPQGVEYGGEADPVRRGIMMSHARAVFCPTKYIEPFGGAAVEAMMCGTPVITTDWGAFPETVIQGVTGYRCRSLDQFVQAARNVVKLSPKAIREHAITHYSTDVVAVQYEEYFERLLTLWGQGWYYLSPAPPST